MTGGSALKYYSSRDGGEDEESQLAGHIVPKLDGQGLLYPLSLGVATAFLPSMLLQVFNLMSEFVSFDLHSAVTREFLIQLS